MKIYQTNELRNVTLIGGPRSGKTTLAESMLFEGGVITRRGSVEDKNTVSDYREIELERKNSIVASVLYAEFGGNKINIIDTPGFADFVGEVVSALHVTDAAFLLVNGYNGVEVSTEVTWRQSVKNHAPSAFIINHLDHEKAIFEETLNQMIQMFGDKVKLIQYPVNPGLGFNSIIDLISMKLLKYPKGGGKPEILDIPDSEKSKSEELRNLLNEAAAEGSEELMEKYFENMELSNEDVAKGIKLSMQARGIFPVLCAAAKENIGVNRILEFINLCVPSPNHGIIRKNNKGNALNCNISDPTSALIFKTSIEPHLGEVSYFKVFSGEITEGMDMINGRNSSKERISQIFRMAGKNRQKVEKVVAGDFAATIKLKDCKTNDSINSTKNAGDEIEPIVFPEPLYFISIKAVNSSDDEKLGAILNEMQRVDTTFKVEYSRELKQMVISAQGELHITAAKWHLDNIHKIDVNLFPTRIPYRETITKPAKAMYRHKKQSGGAGQFGEVHLHIQPYFEGMTHPTDFPVRGQESHDMLWGGKLMYYNCIVGGSIDARFIPAIFKGIMEKMETGPLTGSYARDIAVYVYDGKMHPVDSNEISFKLAGRHAFSEAFKNAGPKIMEPIYDVEVLVPEELMGNVMTDLQGRRAIIMGMDGEGKYQRIRAKVPLAEMNRYATSLSAITSGRATYGMKFSEYAQVPADVQTTLLKKYEEEQKEEE